MYLLSCLGGLSLGVELINDKIRKLSLPSFTQEMTQPSRWTNVVTQNQDGLLPLPQKSSNVGDGAPFWSIASNTTKIGKENFERRVCWYGRIVKQ